MTARPNAGHGIQSVGTTSLTIGGPSPGEGNTIAFNTQRGVLVGTSTATAIRGNSIHANLLSGIQILFGPSAPSVSNATATTASGASCTDCIIEVFSDSADEGRILHGSATADGGGAWLFTCQLACPMPGPNITATATDASPTTSEFSAPFQLVAPIPSPTLSSLSPPSAFAGGPGLTLTINGSGFVNGATVQFGAGPDRAPLTLSSTVITVALSAADVATVGPHNVTVTIPGPCVASCTSNTLVFTVNPAVIDTSFNLVPGATGQLWTGNPVPLAELDTFAGARAFTAVTALFRWENSTQQFQFYFRGFPLNFQTLTGGLQTGEFYFFQSPGNTSVTIPNGTLFVVPDPGGIFPTVVGARGQLWTGSPVATAQLDDAPPTGLPGGVTAVFSWENSQQQFQFWFRGFPDSFQTLTPGLVHGDFYFFQATKAGVNVPMN